MTEQQLAAAGVVARVLGGRSLDAELKALWSSVHGPAPEARPAVQDMAFGTLRFLGEIDEILTRLAQRRISDPVRQVLRVALYQLVHTRAAPHAVVDHAVRAVETLRHAAAKGFVNAVLRNFLRNREALLAEARATDAGRYSHPQWWIEKLRLQYPEHYTEILEQANHHPPFTLRINARAIAVDAYMSQLREAAIDACALGGAAVLLQRALPVERVPGFADGEASVQDAAAQFAAVALDAPAGARVLDACAAPGGKTAHILERADVDLTALDNDEVRLARVRSNLERLHLDAKIVCGDAGRVEWWDGEPFTHVLADVPCSGSGVVRRHPDIKWLRRPADVAAFAERQREILDALWQVLAGGGKLLYSTCSVFQEENNAQIERLLERHSDARLLPLPEPQTNPRRLAGQILPDERHDGFFYALLQKN